MADYFLSHDSSAFEGRVRPALGAAWRARSFQPCRGLCEALAPAAREYARRYHTGGDEPLLFRVGRGLEFDRACWRTLAGEVLLFGAVEIPEFPTGVETLVHLLAPGGGGLAEAGRGGRAPIEQALRGSRDLTFGPAVYRPEHAGYNNAEDVARLADYVGGVRVEEWTEADLAGLPGVEGEEADELAFVREWFPVLVDLYRRSRDNGRVLVIERIY
jgi:hypothetical protein